MFSSRGLLSAVPCPAGDKCLLPKCLFSHAAQAPASSPLQPVAQDSVEEGVDRSQSGPRKRVKSSQEDAESDVPVGVSALTESRSVVQAKIPNHVDQTSSQTGSSSIEKAASPKPVAPVVPSTRRSISPPPIRRDGARNTVLPTQAARKPAREISSTSISTGPAKVPPKSHPVRKKPTEPAKKETLNPRMLKTSPASHDMRYRLLKALHDQLLRLNTELAQDASTAEEALVMSDQDLIILALNVEEKAATDKPTIYTNVTKNKILQYKRMSVADWKKERAAELAREHALENLKNGVSTIAPTEPPKPIETGLSMEEELSLLPRLYTPISGLTKHGYITTIPTAEEITQASRGVEAAKGWEVCDRCKNRFQVFPGRREDGSLTSGGPCTYHFGKPIWPERLADDPKTKRERKYRCCNQSVGDSPGCTQSDSHVFKITEVKRLASVLNFEETPVNNRELNAAAVCIDGEMGYTVHGLELIRLTATSWPSGEGLLDVLVRPVGEILDLNSRFSGVWPEHMANATPYNSASPPPSDTSPSTLHIVSSPAIARSLLFAHLTRHTPLIGHGLENDLNATRIIHPTIIDTALLFPHKQGLPYRLGLKALMFMHLRRHIQVVVDGKMVGHDSKEDANAAGELVKFKVKTEWEALKEAGWRKVEGKGLVPPEREDGTKVVEGAPRGPKLSVEFLERDPTVAPGKSLLGAQGRQGVKRKMQAEDMEDGEIND